MAINDEIKKVIESSHLNQDDQSFHSGKYDDNLMSVIVYPEAFPDKCFALNTNMKNDIQEAYIYESDRVHETSVEMYLRIQQFITLWDEYMGRLDLMSGPKDVSNATEVYDYLLKVQTELHKQVDQIVEKNELN